MAATQSLGRRLLLVLLVLAMAGFGLCSLCGGVLTVSFFSEARASSRDAGWTALILSSIGAAITACCCWLYRRLRGPSETPPPPPPAT